MLAAYGRPHARVAGADASHSRRLDRGTFGRARREEPARTGSGSQKPLRERARARAVCRLCTCIRRCKAQGYPQAVSFREAVVRVEAPTQGAGSESGCCILYGLQIVCIRPYLCAPQHSSPPQSPVLRSSAPTPHAHGHVHAAPARRTRTGGHSLTAVRREHADTPDTARPRDRPSTYATYCSPSAATITYDSQSARPVAFNRHVPLSHFPALRSTSAPCTHGAPSRAPTQRSTPDAGANARSQRAL